MKTLLTVMVVLAAPLVFAEETVLSLDDALRIAHERHPLIRQSAANVGVMDSRAEQARGVLVPQVGASAQYARAHGAFARVGSSTGAPSTSGTSNLFSVGLSATQTLWDFGAIERLRAAGFTREAFGATERATELSVALNVRRAYFAAAAQVVFNSKTRPSDPSVVVEDPASGEVNSTRNGVVCREGSDAAPLVGIIVDSSPGNTCIVGSEESRYAANRSYQVDSRRVA